RYDAVHAREQHVLRLAQPIQAEPPERTTCQIERPCSLLGREPLRAARAPALRQSLQVDHGELDRLAFANDLERPSLHRDKCRAQRLMAGDDSLQRAPQCADVERASHSQGRGDAIEGTLGLQLSQEPQPLLGKGQKATVVLSPSGYRLSYAQFCLAAQHVIHGFEQSLSTRCVEDCSKQRARARSPTARASSTKSHPPRV